MAHIQIKAGDGVEGSGQVLIDGVDMSMHIVADRFVINCPQTPEGEWSVTMTVAVESLDVDLPSAVIEADHLATERRVCEDRS